MTKRLERFSVDEQKRAATVRSRTMDIAVKELLAIGLDARASGIDLSCEVAQRKPRDGDGTPDKTDAISAVEPHASPVAERVTMESDGPAVGRSFVELGVIEIAPPDPHVKGTRK